MKSWKSTEAFFHGKVGNNSAPQVSGGAQSVLVEMIWESFSFQTLRPLVHHPLVLLPVLLQRLQGFARISWTLVSGIHVGFVYDYQGLFYVVLHGRHCGTDGLAAKPVGNQAEMRQAVLNVGLQDRGGSVVPVGSSILIEKICEFFTHLPVKTVNAHR